jgi:DNA-directed RNA polymerase specialized sigma24 family protein
MSPDATKPDFDGYYRANFRRLVHQVQHKKRLGFHDAEDVVQGALAELAPQWEQAENPDALLATIIHRKVIKHWEQQPFTKGVSVSYLGEDAELLHSRAQDPAVAAEHVDTLRQLNRELHLEPIEQDIVLGRARGLSTAEIADMTQTSAVRVRQIGRRLKQRAATFAAPVDPGGGFEAVLAKLIARLPPRQGEVMTWTMRGFHPTAIAEFLGITANDARVNLSHARKALAAMDAKVAMDAEMMIAIRRTFRGRGRILVDPEPVVHAGNLARIIPNRPRGMPNRPRYPVVA